MTIAPGVRASGPTDRGGGVRTGELFDAHARMVFGICRAVLRDPHEAEDATQAVFLSAHEALLRGSVIREPGAWLATVARNECTGRLKARRRAPLELRPEELEGSVTTADDAERRATVAHLRAAIAELPEKQREAVVLRDLYGLHYREICVALGISRPSLDALLFRARRTLRVRLRPVGGAALAVPLAVREGLAQAVPGFAEGAAAAATAAAGAGLLAQLGGSVTAKVAVGAVAVGVAGTTAGGDSLRRSPERVQPLNAPAVVATAEHSLSTPVDRRPVVATTGRSEPEEKRPAKPIGSAPEQRVAAAPSSTVRPPTPSAEPVSRPAASPRPAPEPPPTRTEQPTRVAPVAERTGVQAAPTRSEPARVARTAPPPTAATREQEAPVRTTETVAEPVVTTTIGSTEPPSTRTR